MPSGLTQSFLFFLSIIFLISTEIVKGENLLKDTKTAYINIGKHSNFLRIVFRVDSEELSKNAAIILTESKLLKVTFPEPLSFSYKKTSSEEFKKIALTGEFIEIFKDIKFLVGSNFCLLKIEGLEKYKVLRINNPPRLIIDLYGTEEKKTSSQLKTGDVTPEILPKKGAINSIVIDPGHGGYDKGIHDENNREKDIVLDMAKEISRLLAKEGKRSTLTRKIDQRMSIKDRISITNERLPDIFISIHLSSKPMAVIYTYFTDIDSKDHRNLIAKEAATKIAFYLEKDLNLKTTHLSLPLPLLMQVKAPAIMVELPNFETFSYNKTNIEALSKAIARGLILH